MAVAVKLSDKLVEDAKPYAAAEHRSVSNQIEYWARIGKAVLENPEMPLRLIQDTMLSLEEAKSGQVTTYKAETRSVTELIAQCDPTAPPPADMALWDAARPVGQEVL